MNKIVFNILLFIVVSYKSSAQQEFNIHNLQESFISKKEAQFLNQFPKDFKQFHNYFGWNSKQVKPEALYEVANNYIDYWFNLLNKERNKVFENQIINICKSGKWEADAVNYFQDKSIQYVKEKQRYYLINRLNEIDTKSVLFFLFDGTHPKIDIDFLSNLNISKQTVLKTLFKTYFNVHENDFHGEIINATIDSVSMKEISYVSLNEVKEYKDSELLFIFENYNQEHIDEVEIWSDKMFGRCCTEADLSYSELLEFDITANVSDDAYPYRNLSDQRYTTAFVFKENKNVEIIIKLKRNEETHKQHTNLLIDEVLSDSDTLLKPFKLSLLNGYVKSNKTFKENGRVEEMRVFLNNHYKGTIKLQDTPLIQEFKIDFLFKKNDTVKLIPIKYYKGTVYDDVCISEIQSSLGYITHLGLNKKYDIRTLWEKGYVLKKN